MEAMASKSGKEFPFRYKKIMGCFLFVIIAFFFSILFCMAQQNFKYIHIQFMKMYCKVKENVEQSYNNLQMLMFIVKCVFEFVNERTKTSIAIIKRKKSNTA